VRDRASFGQAGSRPRLRQDGEREANSSQDTPDKQDPTQYKRAASVGTGSLVALASGTDEMAARVLNENIGRGLARSASVLWTDVEDGKKKTAAFDPLIDKRAAALLDEVKAAYQLPAQRGVPAVEPTQSAEEREAVNLLVEPAAVAEDVDEVLAVRRRPRLRPGAVAVLQRVARVRRRRCRRR
jgi:hypothetical protein